MGRDITYKGPKQLVLDKYKQSMAFLNQAGLSKKII